MAAVLPRLPLLRLLPRRAATMLKLEQRPQASRFWTFGSPVLALLITVLIGVGLFVLLGKDPVKGLQAFFWEPIKSGYALGELTMKATPLLLIALGLAGGRTALSIERVAINVDDARIADNAGQQPIDVAVTPDGPAAYFARLPIKQAVTAMRAAGVPAEVSNTAGTFVCNHVFYGLMHRLNTVPAWAQTRGGFVHVPYLPEMAAALPGAPSMAAA